MSREGSSQAGLGGSWLRRRHIRDGVVRAANSGIDMGAEQKGGVGVVVGGGGGEGGRGGGVGGRGLLLLIGLVSARQTQLSRD